MAVPSVLSHGRASGAPGQACGNPAQYVCPDRPDSTAQSLADLDQEVNVLTVVSGTTMHSFARNKVKNAKISALSGSSSAVLDVMQRRADAYIGDSWTNYI